MAPFQIGRRLCLLFEAGEVPYALEAASVQEVAEPDSSGDRIRGALALRDLSLMLGGLPEARPGIGLVLDVSPTLAARVKRVLEVADVAGDPLLRLPLEVGGALSGLVRGAVLHRGRLHLELSAEALPARASAGVAGPASLMPPALLAQLLEEPPAQALVFLSRGRLLGVPLPLVTQVLGSLPSLCPLPAPGGPLLGLISHAQALWPVYSLPALLGEEPVVENACLLTEPAGHNVGLCASKVMGVFQGFLPAQARGEFHAPGLGGGVLFFDLQRMFS